MVTPVEEQEMNKMDRQLVGCDEKPVVSKKTVMVELVEPGKDTGPIKRRRGREKRRLETKIPAEGKIQHYFSKMQIPKEYSEPETKGRVEDVRKRKLEPNGMEEHVLEPILTKTRCLRMEWTPKPVKNTKFGGISN